jgi:hypothetical protein
MLGYARCAFSLLVTFFLSIIMASLSHAQPELTYLSGKLQSHDEAEQTITTQLVYLQELPRPFAFSLSYLNEGHLEEPDKHHRDGFAFQIWARKPVLVPWFSLAAGAGPYCWYDTQSDTEGSNEYARGLGIVSSAAAKIQLPYVGLFLQGQFNWVETINNISTTSILFGIGTDFSSAEVFDKSLPDISEDL